MYLTDAALRSMSMGKVFKDNRDNVNSLDFHRTEDLLVTAGDDDQVRNEHNVSGPPNGLCSRLAHLPPLCIPIYTPGYRGSLRE